MTDQERQKAEELISRLELAESAESNRRVQAVLVYLAGLKAM